jgi:hypothetical protein
MVPFMLLTDLGQVKCYSQRQIGPNMYAPGILDVKNAFLRDAHDRNSVGFQPLGTVGVDQAFQELKQADDAESLMAAWTTKDPPSQAGVGASGEAIASDGIVKGHAYSLTCADFFQADNGEIWRIVQLRNPWGANPQSEWKGELSDNWPGWSMHPRLKEQLHIGSAASDGLFYMRYEHFLDRFSDFGVMGGPSWPGGKCATSETPLKPSKSGMVGFQQRVQKRFQKNIRPSMLTMSPSISAMRTVQLPGTTVQRPVTTVQHPVTTVQPSVNMVQRPVSTVQQTVTTMQRPVTTIVQQPVQTVRPPRRSIIGSFVHSPRGALSPPRYYQ